MITGYLDDWVPDGPDCWLAGWLAPSPASSSPTPQELPEGASPRKSGAEQAERLPRPRRALEQCVVTLLQGLEDAVHVGDLAVVGVVGEVDVDTADAVDRHCGGRRERGGRGRFEIGRAHV